MKHVESKIQEIMLSREEIQSKVQELGKQITDDFQGEELILVSVLRGGLVFLADLIRYVDLPLIYDTLEISSYGDSKVSSGIVRLMKDLTEDIRNKNVIIVEDIIDTGLSLSYLLKNFKLRKPKTIKTCVLLDKEDTRKIDVPIDYYGFKITNKFIVGYGLDYQGYYRNLPYIGVLS